jgi:Lhr-like helicase
VRVKKATADVIEPERATAQTPRQIVDAWFAERDWKIFPFQKAVWRAALKGESGLLHATTGSGKTYAVWLAALQRAMQQDRQAKRKKSGLRVLWITPMRALASRHHTRAGRTIAVLAAVMERRHAYRRHHVE